MRLFETRTLKDSDGNCCSNDGVWCGYCKCCMWLFKCSPDEDIDNWRKENWLYAKKLEKRKHELEQNALLELNDNIPHYFITCTFDEKQISPKDAEKLLLKINKKYDLDHGIASIEYHNDTKPEGGHLHFHLLAPKTKKYKPCVIIDFIEKTTGLKRNFIDLEQQYSNTFTNRVNYICGVKQDSKLNHIKNDREWRKEQGFPHIYLEFTESLRLKYKEQINYALRE